jgi:N-acetylneuraminic acid mutarotase
VEITSNGTTEVAEQWLLLGSIADAAPWGRLVSSYGGSIYSLAENGGHFLKYEPASKTFSTLSPPPHSTWGSISLWLNGKYYIIGGYNSSKTLSYDPNTNTWTTLADSPRQGFFQAVALNGKIYLIGGTPGGLVSYYSQCSVLDPSAGWSHLPSLPIARSGAAVVAEGGDIYVIGGAASPSDLPTNTVYKFSTQSSSWSILPSMPTNRNNAEAVSHNGNIYVIGGYPQSGMDGQVGFKPSPFERYQISVSSWTSLPPLDYSDRHYVRGIIQQGGSLYSPNHGKKFNLAQNQWASFLSRPEGDHGVPVIQEGKVYWVSDGFTVYEYNQ